MAKISLRAYNREIETMMDRGQMDEAVAHCHHILKTFPKNLETYRLLGKIYLETKRYNDAVDIFSRVLVADPNDFVSHVGMSIIRDEESKLDDAVWHMERAFETQPSNAAIQGELQRLYGRRDGVQPPRIRMTRGALAHMYVQGELYPQAISEIKGVLEEDPGRSDMQVLLALSYYRSGQKNDAADVASALLRRYPYCLDANRVLIEILGSERSESAQVYRQRVNELDPYAAQATGSVFQSKEVSDAAVTLEHFDWNGQPSGMQPDWGSTQAIKLESGSARNEQPDWLKNASSETKFPALSQAEPASSSNAFPAFDDSSSPPSPASNDDIPDFLREAGWGESTGTFDESKLIFQDEPEKESPSSAQPIEQGDMPDWLKAMKPPETEQPAEQEEMPDWINKIGTGGLSVSSPESVSGDQSDWMKGFGQEEEALVVSSVSNDQPDWLQGIGAEAEMEVPAASMTDQPDWLDQLGDEKEASGILPSERPSNDMDFLNQLTSEPEEEPKPAPSTPAVDTGQLGTSEQEIDDALSWFEGLAAKQGATEGLLTKPEERMDDEPDWIKQAKGMNAVEPQKPAQPPAPPVQTPSVAVPLSAPVNVDELGKSEKEIDDALSWFEGLAAKQGATEGLLTKPEERTEKEPDWVTQAKDAGEKQPSVAPLQAEVESISTAGDTEAWLRSLDAEETTSEPVATANDDTNAWLKSLDEPEVEAPIQSEQSDGLPAWMQNIEQEDAPAAESASPKADAVETSSWMSSVEESVSQIVAPIEEAPKEDISGWLSGLDKEEEQAAMPVASSDDLPAWLRDDTGELVAEPPKIEPTRPEEWHPVDEKPEPIQPPPPTPQPAPVQKAEPKPVQNTPEPAPKAKKPVAKKTEVKPATPPEPYREPVTRKGTGMLSMPVDSILGSARAELTRSNIPGALETYDKLIKKGRFLEEVIYDLRDALYRYPVEVSIWQTLGDAYMRANQLQDALDAYTKAEELLR